MNFTLRFSVFCFHSLLLITHLVHLCVVTWMLQCFWVLRWLSKEWQGAKNQNFISSMIELVFSKVIKLKRPLNFLWMAKPSFCHERPTWWLRWQIHGCPQPSPFPNHNSQVLLGHGTLLGNFLVFASTFLGESHHYIRVQQCWVTVTSGTNFTVFAPISLHFSHFPQLGWTRSTLAPLSIQALESLFRSDTFPFISLLLHTHPSQTPLIMLLACSLGKPICYFSHHLCWLLRIFYGKGLDKICPQRTDRPESCRSAAVHFFTCLIQCTNR